jgi:cytochrome c-type biogenesis protein
MFEIGGVSVLLAFIAGLFSVASPCVLPLVPAYLGYLTGATMEGVPVETRVAQSSLAAEGSGGAGTVVLSPKAHAPSPFFHALAFVAGFSVIFVLFGVSLGIVGYALRDNQDVILKVAGTLLIVMGLHLSGVITIPFLDQERRLDVGRGANVGYARSFFVGSAFSAGWSPCIGPTLGAILTLAVSSDNVAGAGVLLLVYSAGLSIPFLALGLAYNGVKPVYAWLKRYMGVINYLSGALLIIIGILVFTDSLINMNDLFNVGFLNDVSSDK